jgi:hypothetical protein
MFIFNLNLTLDMVITAISVISCVILNGIGFHYWRESKKADLSKLAGNISKFYFIWKRCFGPVGMILAYLPAFVPGILSHLFGINSKADVGTWAVATIIIYPIFFLFYYIFFVWGKRK